jgi:hypothetical protein
VIVGWVWESLNKKVQIITEDQLSQFINGLETDKIKLIKCKAN